MYILDVKDDHVLQVFCQEPSTSSKYPHEGPPILDTLLIKISTRNFQGIFLRVKKHHPWHQGWPCPPSLQSGTLNVLQVPPLLTPHSWHTSNSWYIYWKCVKNGRSFMLVLGGHWGFLTGDLEDRVILDVMDVLGRPQGSYPESFVSLSLFLAEI